MQEPSTEKSNSKVTFQLNTTNYTGKDDILQEDTMSNEGNHKPSTEKSNSDVTFQLNTPNHTGKDNIRQEDATSNEGKQNCT